MKYKLVSLFLVGFLLVVSSLGAWSYAGHRKIALIAYDRLEEGTRARVSEMLRRHERIKQDFRMPDNIQSAPSVVQDRWLFMTAATWPDRVRNLTGSERERYSHSKWHYINEPLFLGDEDKEALAGQTLANLETKAPPLDLCDEPEMETCGDLNVIQALKLSVAKLEAASTPDPEKAIYLSWLLHLAGDLHQPLHSTALFSAILLPRGDQGGNLIRVGRKRLHAHWDDQPGTTARSLRRLNREARSLLRDQGLRAAARDSTSDLSFEAWLEQSHELAWEHVYDEAILDAVSRYEAQVQRKLRYEEWIPAPRPSREYRREALSVAEKR
ncbi:MAG: S1/P1 nuclease, partial [Acidobacteriota bacterium]|nr:S1/P1 nuclease [Acidobacteriota bacterium]